MKGNLRKMIICCILLTAISLLLLFLPLEKGLFFGSEGDWYSQHIGIAESLRQTILETHSFIPQYIHLGGGSSIYDFSYYGLLRPDILLSCIMPKIEMRYIIAGYAVCGVTASVNLCFLWLKKQRVSLPFAFAGTVLFATASCFYHAHNQIMFVNYMPFLILALIGVDRLLIRNRMGLLICALFLIYIHSFYYAISTLFVVGVYALWKLFYGEKCREKMKEEKDNRQMIKPMVKPVGKLLAAVVISIGMAMVLLLPTGLDILSNEKDAGSFMDTPMKAADWSLGGLLYSPYGCGMTLVILYCLLLSMAKKRKRILASILACCVLFPVVAYVLNGFLYSRTKILIPFVPLFVLIASDTLQELYGGKQKHNKLLLFCCALPALCSAWRYLILADVFILSVWVFIECYSKTSDKIKHLAYGMILLIPVLVSLGVNMSGSRLKDICAKAGIEINNAYLKMEDGRQKHFEEKEIENFVSDNRYRFDILSDGFVNCNLLADGKINKTSMYSSVTNTEYARFYYDIMRNPISINNRVALIPNQNNCFFYFMGVKYILTEEDQIPRGYKKAMQRGNYVLAENDEVLPVCYGTTELLSEEIYEQLDFPDTLEALCTKAVIPSKKSDLDIKGDIRNSAEIFTPHIQEENIENFFIEAGEKKLLYPSGRQESYTLPFRKSLSGKMLIISFHVESNNGKSVVISINGIKNKLSGKKAPYPNHNHEFTYILSAEGDMHEIKIEASEGNYTIENLKIYTVDYNSLKHEEIAEPQIQEDQNQSECNVFHGEITMEKAGYFITSYPYRKGYQVKIDGKSVKIEKVNIAFLGFPIAKGTHEIEITYKAPGFLAGVMISMLSGVLLILITIHERKSIG